MQGILLAAGEGKRFQAETDNNQDKLLAMLDSKPILWHSAYSLMMALPNSIAVVQPHQVTRKQILADLGFDVVESQRAKSGMGEAIADAVKATKAADGWLIALADMPWVSSALMKALHASIKHAEMIAAPRYQQQRGQPVAFGAAWYPKLSTLRGDKGARDVLRTAHINWIEWHDDSIHRDVDTAQDLL